MDGDPGGDDGDARLAAARDQLLGDHRGTVTEVLAAARTVADGWRERGVTDRAGVVDPLSSAIERRGLGSPLVSALVDAVDAAGYALRADPVPAPPYLAVTSRGPVLRATVADGRVVVSVEAFAVDRSGDRPRYVRREVDPEGAVVVELRGQGGGGPR